MTKSRQNRISTISLQMGLIYISEDLQIRSQKKTQLYKSRSCDPNIKQRGRSDRALRKKGQLLAKAATPSEGTSVRI